MEQHKNPPASDLNLLFGILAVQMDFINRDQLVTAMNGWVLDKNKSLGTILVEQRALSADLCKLLHNLVQEHVKRHNDSPEKSLAALSTVESLRDDLARIPDRDLQASMGHVPGRRAADCDPFATAAPTAGTPTSSGQRFRILRPHAKGGLGQVYVALDEELHREVALKEIQDRFADDSESRARFLLEAEITGRLEHPSIVPVYGLGQYADGRPFYAMRFIKGDSLKEAIEAFHKNAETDNLELRKLLARFIEVCNAIQYAHDRGILHRDLKPGNIMLGKYGETLVVDWGLAKAHGVSGPRAESSLKPVTLRDSTATLPGSAVGTPSYLSPEQAGGEAAVQGPCSDVYSLGATLYCLLTGTAPMEASLPTQPHDKRDLGSILNRVRRGDYPRPRQIKPNIDRALEAICLKAMALCQADRYVSPRALADDLENWLADRPVTAWPEPWTVKARRWVGEHRTMVAGAAAAVLVGLVSMFILAVVLEVDNEKLKVANKSESDARKLATEKGEEAARDRDLAQKERDEKNKHFDEARAAVDLMLTRVGEEKLADIPQMEQVQRELLEDALKFYKRFSEEPGTNVRDRRQTALAYRKVGDITRGLAQYPAAEKAYNKAVELHEKLVAEFPADSQYQADLAESHANMGLLFKRGGRLNEAEQAYAAALKIRRKLAAAPATPKDKNDLAQSENNLGMLLDEMGRRQQAEQALGRAIEIWQNLAREFPNRSDYRKFVAGSSNNLANLYGKSGRRPEAEKLYVDAIALWQKLAVEHPKDMDFRAAAAAGQNNLGTLLNQLGRHGEAVKAYRESLDGWQKLADDFPTVPDYRSKAALSMNNLAAVLIAAGNYEEAEKTGNRALELRQKIANDYPAVPGYRSDLAGSHDTLGRLYAKTKQPDKAEQAFAAALEIQEKLVEQFANVGEYRRQLALSHFHRGLMLAQANNDAEAAAAEVALEKAVDMQQKLADQFSNVPDYRGDLATTLENLGNLRLHIDKNFSREAEKILGRAVEARQKLADAFPDVAEYRGQLAGSYLRQAQLLDKAGRVQDGDEALARCLRLTQQLALDFPKAPALAETLARRQYLLGERYEKTGRRPQAETAYERAADTWQKLADDFPKTAEYRTGLALTCNTLVAFLKKKSQGSQQLEKAMNRANDSWEKLANEFPMSRHREEFAASCDQLGLYFLQQHKSRQAEPAFTRALKAWQRLSDDFPESAKYRANLARTQFHLGQSLAHDNKQKEAEQACRGAVEQLQKLIDGSTANSADNIDYRSQLVAACKKLAELLQQTMRPAEAEKQLLQALEVCQKLAVDRKNVVKFREETAQLQDSLGKLLQEQKAWKKAANHFEGAIATARALPRTTKGGKDQSYVQEPKTRAILLSSYHGLAECQQSLGQHADAAGTVGRASLLSHLKEADWLHAAQVLAQCMVLAEKDAGLSEPKRREAAQAYGDQAVQLLRDAVKKGFKDIQSLKINPAFAPLRMRPDFQEVIAKLEAQNKT